MRKRSRITEPTSQNKVGWAYLGSRAALSTSWTFFRRSSQKERSLATPSGRIVLNCSVSLSPLGVGGGGILFQTPVTFSPYALTLLTFPLSTCSSKKLYETRVPVLPGPRNR